MPLIELEQACMVMCHWCYLQVNWNGLTKVVAPYKETDGNWYHFVSAATTGVQKCVATPIRNLSNENKSSAKL